MDQLAAALELFRLDKGRYPTDGEGLQALVNAEGITNRSGSQVKDSSQLRDEWGHSSVYFSRENGDGFELISQGGDRQPEGDGLDQDIKRSN